jgi:hypothetical protein
MGVKSFLRKRTRLAKPQRARHVRCCSCRRRSHRSDKAYAFVVVSSVIDRRASKLGGADGDRGKSSQD